MSNLQVFFLNAYTTMGLSFTFVLNRKYEETKKNPNHSIKGGKFEIRFKLRVMCLVGKLIFHRDKARKNLKLMMH